MIKSGANPNIYYLHQERQILIVMLYIDDLIIIGNLKEKIVWLPVQLVNKFKMTNLGQLRHYLSIHFSFTKEIMFMSQIPYIEDILQMFRMAKCNATKVPIAKNTNFTTYMSGQKVDGTTYRKMVGKLIYLVNTRPNIKFSISTISQILIDRQLPHLNALKQIF